MNEYLRKLNILDELCREELFDACMFFIDGSSGVRCRMYYRYLTEPVGSIKRWRTDVLMELAIESCWERFQKSSDTLTLPDME